MKTCHYEVMFFVMFIVTSLWLEFENRDSVQLEERRLIHLLILEDSSSGMAEAEEGGDRQSDKVTKATKLQSVKPTVWKRSV